jgi:hypothetical protein
MIISKDLIKTLIQNYKTLKIRRVEAVLLVCQIVHTITKTLTNNASRNCNLLKKKHLNNFHIPR